MKKFIITEEEKKRILNLHESATRRQYLSEQSSGETSDFYSSILGYLAQHGDKILKDSNNSLYTLAEKKEVMKFCESKRDNKQPQPLSRNAMVMFKTVAKMVNDSDNKNGYIEIGKTVKINPYV